MKRFVMFRHGVRASCPSLARRHRISQKAPGPAPISAPTESMAVQKVTVEFKKVPDPHWAWRPAAAEVWSVTFNGPPVGRAQVGDFRLDAGTMTFSYMRQDLLYECKLQQQPSDAFTGRCASDASDQTFRITLNPPVPASKD